MSGKYSDRSVPQCPGLEYRLTLLPLDVCRAKAGVQIEAVILMMKYLKAVHQGSELLKPVFSTLLL